MFVGVVVLRYQWCATTPTNTARVQHTYDKNLASLLCCKGNEDNSIRYCVYKKVYSNQTFLFT